jgi:hypothetical protein
MKAFEDLGVAPQRVLEKAGYEAAEEFTANKLAFFRSLYVGIKEGHQSIEEAFPRKAAPGKAPTLDDLATGSAVDRPYTPPTPPPTPLQEDLLSRLGEEELRQAEEASVPAPPATEPAPQANQAPAPPTQPGAPPAVLEGPELQAALKKLANRISRTIKPAALDDIEAEIIAELRIPNSDAEDLLDLLANRRAELDQAAG